MTIEKEIDISELEKDGVLESIFDEFEINKNIIYYILKENKRICVLIPYENKIEKMLNYF